MPFGAQDTNEGIVVMAVHERLETDSTTKAIIESVSKISVLPTSKLQQRETAQSLYKKLERLEAKMALIDTVIEDEYVPVTDEMRDDIRQMMTQVSGLM